MSEIEDFTEDFDFYWLSICDYANSVGVSPRYIEEEFILEGELVMVDPVKTDKR